MRLGIITTVKHKKVQSVNDSQAGFSLLEIMFVVLIMAIVIAVSNSIWNGMQQRQLLSQATIQLATFLNEVQNRARRQNKNLYLYYLKPSSQQANWCLTVSEQELAAPINCAVGLMQFTQSTAAIRLSEPKSQAKLAFYGRRDLAQTATLILSSSAGQSRVIISQRGRIRYCSDNGKLNGLPTC